MLLAPVSLLGLASPVALAAAEPGAPLPDAVRAMIIAAQNSGDAATLAAVVQVARQTNPDAGGAIDALLTGETAAPDAATTGTTATTPTTAAAETAAAPVPVAAAPEPAPRPGFFSGWSGKGEFGAFAASGNSSSSGASGALALSRVQGKWTLGLAANIDFQRSGGVTTTQQYLAEIQPRYQLADRLFLYGLGRWERDPVQGLAARWSASGGVGVRAVQTNTLVVNVRGGPAWQRTRLVPGPLRNVLRQDRLTGLAALDASWQLSPSLRLSETASAFIGPGNTNVIATTALDLRVNSKLSTRIAYVVDYDTSPPAGSKATDTITRFTLVYDF